MPSVTSRAAAAAAQPERSPRFWSSDRGMFACLLVAVILVTAGLGLRRIAIANTDLESLAQLSRDAQTIYLSGSPAPGMAADLLRDQAPGLRWWKRAWFALNGQVDSRLLHLGGLVVHALAAGILFLVLTSVWPRRWVAALAVVVVGIFEVPALAALSPAADSIWGADLCFSRCCISG